MFNLLKKGINRIKEVVSLTKMHLGHKLGMLFKEPLSEQSITELEKLLLEADLGVTCTEELIEIAKKTAKNRPSATPDDLIVAMKEHLLKILTLQVAPHPTEEKPQVVLLLGVNGSGKTTSTIKLASLYKKNGQSVMVAAADTFRAAAVEQLTFWSKQCDFPLIKSHHGADPASVAYDALKSSIATGTDILFVDTAGRLDTSDGLMDQLARISRVMKKLSPNAPHQTLFVLDATMGQNGLEQAKKFHATTPLTGIILTKADGTAKGGVIISIYKTLSLPVLFLGTGESAQDLIPFDAQSYLSALFD